MFYCNCNTSRKIKDDLLQVDLDFKFLVQIDNCTLPEHRFLSYKNFSAGTVRQKKSCTKPFFSSSLFIHVLQKDLAETSFNKKDFAETFTFRQDKSGNLHPRSSESFTLSSASVHGGACHLSTMLL
jgi:hypothetical protein